MQKLVDIVKKAKDSIASGKWPQSVVFEAGTTNDIEGFISPVVGRLICEGSSQIDACGKCHSCKCYLANSHQGVIMVAPDGASIKVDAIRLVIDKVSKTQHSLNQVVIIQEADKLNVQSANALLKVLEEPKPNLYFILTTQAITQLLPTIRSRVQKVRLVQDLGSDSVLDSKARLLQSLFPDQAAIMQEESEMLQKYGHLVSILWHGWPDPRQPVLGLVDSLSNYEAKDIVHAMQMIQFARSSQFTEAAPYGVAVYHALERIFGVSSRNSGWLCYHEITESLIKANKIIKSPVALTATYQIDQLFIETTTIMARYSQYTQ